MAERHELCVNSRLSNLATIADFVAERARLAQLDDDQVFDVQMAVDEACTNIMEHAYRGRQGEVRVCCYEESNDFVVCIYDGGAAFDPATVPDPDVSGPLEERDVGGLGLFFMRRLMDEVRFGFDPATGNELIMRKRRKAMT